MGSTLSVNSSLCFPASPPFFLCLSPPAPPLASATNTALQSTAPVWQGETSKADWRGKLIVIEMILNIAGFSLSMI